MSGRLNAFSTAHDLPVWDGTRFDVGWAIDVIYKPDVGLPPTLARS
jgi:hypothetical protein